MTIFLVFTLIAYITFGAQVLEFSSMGRASMSTFRVLMGDFDVDSMYAVDSMMAQLWFLLFNVIVLLILLNMLLAIVMETYSEVKGEQGSDTPTIVKQAFSTYRQLNDTRGFVGLWPIICEFEDDDDPAHPGDEVTADSLRSAFTNRDGISMSYAQAMYLVTKACEYVANEFAKGESVSMVDGLQMTAKLKGMVLRCQEKINYMSPEISVMRQMLISMGGPAIPVPDPRLGS